MSTSADVMQAKKGLLASVHSEVTRLCLIVKQGARKQVLHTVGLQLKQEARY